MRQSFIFNIIINEVLRKNGFVLLIGERIGSQAGTCTNLQRLCCSHCIQFYVQKRIIVNLPLRIKRNDRKKYQYIFSHSVLKRSIRSVSIAEISGEFGSKMSVAINLNNLFISSIHQNF